jgi:hypothetical protein
MTHEASNNFTTIREIFHPIALLGGRQYAAYLCICKVEGRLYLSEQNQWLWSPLKGEKLHILADWQLEELVSPLEVCRTLLLSAQDTMKELLRRIDCAHPTLTSLWTESGRRYTADVICDVFQRNRRQNIHASRGLECE